jgi:channel protein (hemolysin III family)
MSGQVSLDYDRAEIRPMASCSIEIAPILVYVIGLVTMLALSAAYNMWPVCVLRRFDHSAIYLLIATRRSWRR